MSVPINRIRGGVITHRPDCPKPTLANIKLSLNPETGETRAECKACLRAHWISDQAAKKAPIAPSRYRCPHHPNQSVRRTPRGYAVGCPTCTPTKENRNDDDN